MAEKNSLKVNRAPVLTLWAVIVAERLGFSRDEALTLGKSVAGLNAQSKGQSLGIFTPGKKDQPVERAREREQDKEFFIDLMGRAIPAANTKDGVRATVKGKPVSPLSVREYLEKKFGDQLDEVESAMRELSDSYSPEELAGKAYGFYEKFRPEIPEGKKGWGAAGELDLEKIRGLKK